MVHCLFNHVEVGFVRLVACLFCLFRQIVSWPPSFALAVRSGSGWWVVRGWVSLVHPLHVFCLPCVVLWDSRRPRSKKRQTPLAISSSPGGGGESAGGKGSCFLILLFSRLFWLGGNTAVGRSVACRRHL